MSYYESIPGTVSYERLLRIVQQRTTVDRSYNERLYLVELTNKLWERVRQVRSIENSSDSRSDDEQ